MQNSILDHRNIMLLVLLISSVALIPDQAISLARPFLAFWLRIKQCHRSFTIRPPRQENNRFWEIDMTRLEP